MIPKGLSSLIITSCCVAAIFGQTPAKEPRKVNARPMPTPSAKGEAFDKADISAMAGQCVRFDTEVGLIELELYPEQAPETVRNFLNLTVTGLFDSTTFNRVVPGFVIQGGNMWSREGGKVSKEIGERGRRTIPDEPNSILHERGVISMARPDEPNQAKTDFFILVAAAPYLDGKFAAFGRVTAGMEVVDTINKAAVAEDKPEKPVKIKTATVFACVPGRR